MQRVLLVFFLMNLFISNSTLNAMDLNYSNANERDYSGYTLLMLTACYGDAITVAKLLNDGAHVNLQDVGGKTALFHAVANGHTAIVELLLNKNANAYLEDNDGNTVLDVAEERGYDIIAALIITNNMPINSNNQT